MSFKKILLILLGCVPVLSVQSCGPNLARTNARIEKGFNIGAAGVYNGTSRDTEQNERQNFGQADFDIGFSKRKENNFGISLLAKVGFLSDPGIELYVELPSSHPFYYGFGGEVGVGNGAFAIASYYFAEEFFITLTGRVLYWDHRQVLYNPQMAIGFSRNQGSPTISLVSGYQYYSGLGLDRDFDFSGEGRRVGYVNKLIYGGVSFQF